MSIRAPPDYGRPYLEPFVKNMAELHKQQAVELIHTILQFLGVVLTRQPALLDDLAGLYEAHPAEVVDLLAANYQQVRGGRPEAVSTRHPKEYAAMMRKIRAAHKRLVKAGKGGGAKGGRHDLAVLDYYLHVFEDPSRPPPGPDDGGAHPVLWTMLVLSFLAFAVLVLHMGCRFELWEGARAQMAPICETADSYGVLAGIDDMYRSLDPYTSGLEPHALVILDGAAAVSDAVAPYVAPIGAAAGAAIDVARPAAVAAYDATSPHLAAAWGAIEAAAQAAGNVWSDVGSPAVRGLVEVTEPYTAVAAEHFKGAIAQL